jgi:hypothetical protein
MGWRCHLPFRRFKGLGQLACQERKGSGHVHPETLVLFPEEKLMPSVGEQAAFLGGNNVPIQSKTETNYLTERRSRCLPVI